MKEIKKEEKETVSIYVRNKYVVLICSITSVIQIMRMWY